MTRVALLVLAVLLLVATHLQDTEASARSVGQARRDGRKMPPVRIEDNEDDEDEDDGDEWDFMSDAAVLAAIEAEKQSHKCAETLDASRVNDDYCDCADGSDEPATGACALVTLPETFAQFECHSGGQRVATAFVRDGVCDCCDGSDEMPSVCGNTCEQRKQEQLKSLQSRLRVVRNALEIRAAYEPFAAARMKQLNQEFSDVMATASALQRAFQYKQEALQAQMEQTGERPPPQQIHELQRMYQQLNHWQFTAYVHRKLLERETFDVKAGREAFAALVGECFPYTVNEKQLKGGSANVIPREYIIVFCPFQNVTQTEPGYAQWQRAERQSKLGVTDDNEEEEEASQPDIVMGVWDQWIDNGVPKVVGRQRFDHGQACANEQARVVNVDVLCGDKNRIVSVEEPEMCVYNLQFETPAACTIEHEAKLVATITELKGEKQSRLHEEL